MAYIVENKQTKKMTLIIEVIESFLSSSSPNKAVNKQRQAIKNYEVTKKPDWKGENYRSSRKENATAQCMIKSSLGDRKKMSAQFRGRLKLKRSNT